VRGHLVVLAGDDGTGRRRAGRPGHAAVHPPAVLLDAQPLDRDRGAARRPRRRGRRLHRLLPPRAGDAHRPLPGRDPGGVTGQPGEVAVAGPAHRAVPGTRAGAGRDGPRARAEPGADGAGMGAARRAGHHGADRGELGAAAGGQRGGAGAPGVQRRGAGRDRPARRGRRHRPVGRAPHRL
ncbi:MAG: L-glyceraldehyde 3-phosphate reductase, partial [uncultured Thermomicrobiales bacterium]